MPGAVEILVRTGASRTELAGTHDGAIVVRLQAKPVEGAANKALVELIAERIGVPRSSVRIRRGLRSRRKLVEVDGIEGAVLRAKLEA